jgi:ATP-dependent NAD(P)H-hydrate dehydratase
LSYIFCAKEAATPIKSYSPELMVSGVYDTEQISREPDVGITEMVERVANMFSRMHVLVIGPGLGRKPEVLIATKHIIQRARAEDIPMVIDADGLFLISQDPGLIRDAKNVVITPNPVEFKRIAEALQLDVPSDESCEDAGRTGLTATGTHCVCCCFWTGLGSISAHGLFSNRAAGG